MYEDGSEYEGEFKNGQREGMGRLSTLYQKIENYINVDCRDIYTGQFKNGLYSGML